MQEANGRTHEDLGLQRRFEHGPKVLYRLIRKGKFREVTLALRTEFDIDPEFLDDVVQGVHQRIQMAMKNQEKCGHGQDARKIWLPAFERAVEDATGLPLREFIPADPLPRRKG